MFLQTIIQKYTTIFMLNIIYDWQAMLPTSAENHGIPLPIKYTKHVGTSTVSAIASTL